MASKNDITGDLIKSRALSAAGRENYDLIFAVKTPAEWCEYLNYERLSADMGVKPIKFIEFKLNYERLAADMKEKL